MLEWIDAPSLAIELQSDDPPTVLDVRNPTEWAGRHGIIEGAVLRSSTMIYEWIDEIAACRDELVVVTCHTHNRSAQVAHLLRKAGHPDVRVLRDGMKNWSTSGFPSVTWKG